MDNYERLYNEANFFLSKNKVNVFKVIEWKNLLESEDFDINEYEKILLYFNVNIYKDEIGFASIAPPRVLNIVEEQVYLFLKDKRFQGKSELIISGLISEICVEVSNHFDINAFVLGGFLDLLFLGIMKIGINAWCKYYEEKTNVNGNEL